MKLQGIIINVVVAAAAAAVTYFGFPRYQLCPEVPCKTCYTMDCKQAFNGIDVNLAMQLVRNYTNNHLAVINGSPNLFPPAGAPRTDAQSVWFKLDEIKRFIYEIESQMCTNCKGDRPELGVRIYYGEYPAGYKNPATSEDYSGLHTVLMVPTYWDGKYDTDFDPGYFDGDCKPKGIDTADSLIIALVPGTSSVPTGNNAMRNHGGLYPPPYPNSATPTQPVCAGTTFLNYVMGYTCTP